MIIIHLYWSIPNTILCLPTPKFTSKCVKNVNIDPGKCGKHTQM